MTDIERAVREIVDGPTPPPPAEPVDDRDDDDDGAHTVCPVLIVWPGGAITTRGLGGTLLVAWCVLASAYAVYAALAAFWESLTVWVTVTGIVGLLVSAGASTVALLLVAACTSGLGWLKRRRAAAADAAVQP